MSLIRASYIAYYFVQIHIALIDNSRFPYINKIKFYKSKNKKYDTLRYL